MSSVRSGAGSAVPEFSMQIYVKRIKIAYLEGDWARPALVAWLSTLTLWKVLTLDRKPCF